MIILDVNNEHRKYVLIHILILTLPTLASCVQAVNPFPRTKEMCNICLRMDRYLFFKTPTASCLAI